jgi:hypothetical protein
MENPPAAREQRMFAKHGTMAFEDGRSSYAGCNQIRSCFSLKYD